MVIHEPQVQIMQHTHMHKAVTGRVEAKSHTHKAVTGRVEAKSYSLVKGNQTID